MLYGFDECFLFFESVEFFVLLCFGKFIYAPFLCLILLTFHAVDFACGGRCLVYEEVWMCNFSPLNYLFFFFFFACLFFSFDISYVNETFNGPIKNNNNNNNKCRVIFFFVALGFSGVLAKKAQMGNRQYIKYGTGMITMGWMK
ncbi:hypothetical protein B0T21DRAFT_200044 [Apiosordaria backusii]|uniref:Uncharacterized protein n=1 Tax=Apiosordaria backusii TaxID=314023 RepID=A0AA40BEE2_9PEZI|nr:hypothetical protein B0T21DRAFT_200044 [Apiosordaria backusii]